MQIGQLKMDKILKMSLTKEDIHPWTDYNQLWGEG